MKKLLTLMFSLLLLCAVSVSVAIKSVDKDKGFSSTKVESVFKLEKKVSNQSTFEANKSFYAQLFDIEPFHNRVTENRYSIFNAQKTISYIPKGKIYIRNHSIRQCSWDSGNLV